MRLGILLNWHQALLTTALILVMFTPNSSQCEAGLWIEQGRYPPTSVSIVLIKRKTPNWLLGLKAIARRWQVNRKVFVRAICRLLGMALLIWINILVWLIEKILTNPKIPMHSSGTYQTEVCGATLEVEMMISLIPTVTTQAVKVEQECFVGRTDSVAKQESQSKQPLQITVQPTVNLQVGSSDCQLPLPQFQTPTAPLATIIGLKQPHDCLELEQKHLITDTSICPVIVSSVDHHRDDGAHFEKKTQQVDEATIIVQNKQQMTTSASVIEQQKSPTLTKKAVKKTNYYQAAVEEAMKKFYQTLNEKDRRRYAAVEAIKLGHGGQSYMAKVLGLSRKTIAKGIKELKGELTADRRIRAPGAGRKPYTHHHADIDSKFLDVLKHYIAGNPMKENVLWTNLSWAKIAELLHQKHEIKVSTTVIKQLLKKNNFRRRKAQKRRTMKQVALRNEQFENIASIRAKYEATGNPVISMDTKKKEHLGNYYRDGHLYTRKEVQTFDHDFKNIAEGIIVPHGLYDDVKYKSHITIGTSKDTSEFATDSLKLWWNKYGKYDYPDATSILILCDGGGSNSSRHYIFKEDLQKLANEIGIEIRIAHYPPYCSKYNPIEHRLFPHVTRACQGVILRTHQVAKELMEKTSTKTGLTTTVDILDKEYQTGRKYAPDFKENMPIIFDSYLGKWNYRAVPNG